MLSATFPLGHHDWIAENTVLRFHNTHYQFSVQCIKEAIHKICTLFVFVHCMHLPFSAQDPNMIIWSNRINHWRKIPNAVGKKFANSSNLPWFLQSFKKWARLLIDCPVSSNSSLSDHNFRAIDHLLSHQLSPRRSELNPAYYGPEKQFLLSTGRLV